MRDEVIGLFTYSISGHRTRHPLKEMTEEKFEAILGEKWKTLLVDPEEYGFQLELGKDGFYHVYCSESVLR